MVDISVNIAGLKLSNPTVLASGIMGTDIDSLKKMSQYGAGAVTMKSITREARSGHANPTVIQVEGGFLNAVGYSNMGLENALIEFADVRTVGVPVIASIVSETVEGFGHLAAELSGLGFDAVEAVLSCPHTPGLGLLAGHGTPEATRAIAEEVKKRAKKPVFIKLSPSTSSLGDVAKAAMQGGADAINMGNTLGPGMVIDTGFGKPVLDFKVGGMSGKAIKPIAVRCVYDVYVATEGKIPIIGTGGVTTGLDAIEMFMAGASAVGVGTGVYYRGLGVFKLISDEIREYLERKQIGSITELVGVAHG